MNTTDDGWFKLEARWRRRQGRHGSQHIPWPRAHQVFSLFRLGMLVVLTGAVLTASYLLDVSPRGILRAIW